MWRRKISLLILPLALGIALPAVAESADSGIQIMVLSGPDRQQVATVQPGDTLQLTNGDTVRLRMSYQPPGSATRYPSAKFEVVSGKERLAVKEANSEVGNVTFTAYVVSPRKAREDTVIRYEIVDRDEVPRQLWTGTFRVEVRERSPEPPPVAQPSAEFYGIIVYQDENYRGRSQNITVDRIPSLHASGFGNDIASSARIQPGCRAVLYQDENYRGRSIVMTSDIPELHYTALGNDTMSSLTLDCSGANDHEHRDRHDERDHHHGQ
jgi:Beta/Gamma crystallin